MLFLLFFEHSCNLIQLLLILFPLVSLSQRWFLLKFTLLALFLSLNNFIIFLLLLATSSEELGWKVKLCPRIPNVADRFFGQCADWFVYHWTRVQIENEILEFAAFCQNFLSRNISSILLYPTAWVCECYQLSYVWSVLKVRYLEQSARVKMTQMDLANLLAALGVISPG